MQGWYLVGIVFLVSFVAHAELASIKGNVKVSGNGCPAGTFSVTLSPDKTDISVIFDEYTAEVSTPRPLFDYKSCRIKIPVQVAPGYRLKVKSQDYRGFVSLASRWTSAFFFSQVFIKNGFRLLPTPVQYVYLKGPKDEDFLFSKVGKYYPSGCSNSYELTFNSWFFALAYWRDTSDSFLMIDSFDFSLDSGQVEIVPCR